MVNCPPCKSQIYKKLLLVFVLCYTTFLYHELTVLSQLFLRIISSGQQSTLAYSYIVALVNCPILRALEFVTKSNLHGRPTMKQCIIRFANNAHQSCDWSTTVAQNGLTWNNCTLLCIEDSAVFLHRWPYIAKIPPTIIQSRYIILSHFFQLTGCMYCEQDPNTSSCVLTVNNDRRSSDRVRGCI